ncbi:hypothetical protein NEOC65_000192 [Neochlamydia sp. AcF65]|nr:hypothetical protein [Neochlamydia sp. AcF65]MBS4171429.1 hypothetical protein [Neochlamydia sp. AcF95]
MFGLKLEPFDAWLEVICCILKSYKQALFIYVMDA